VLELGLMKRLWFVAVFLAIGVSAAIPAAISGELWAYFLFVFAAIAGWQEFRLYRRQHPVGQPQRDY